MHYPVLVIGEDVHWELAPFAYPDGIADEFTCHVDQTEDYSTWYGEHCEWVAKNPDKGTLISFADWLRDDMLVISEEQEEGDECGNDSYAVTDEEGNVLRVMIFTNPEARYDWYEVGGRWDNYLVKRDGTNANQCLMSEFDYDAMRADNYRAASAWWSKASRITHKRKWQTFNDVQKQHPDASYGSIYWEQDVPRQLKELRPRICPSDIDALLGITNCQFTRRAENEPLTCAIVKNREWYASDDEFSWDVVPWSENEKKWQKLYWDIIRGTKPDELVTIVDCHN